MLWVVILGTAAQLISQVILNILNEPHQPLSSFGKGISGPLMTLVLKGSKWLCNLDMSLKSSSGHGTTIKLVNKIVVDSMSHIWSSNLSTSLTTKSLWNFCRPMNRCLMMMSWVAVDWEGLLTWDPGLCTGLEDWSFVGRAHGIACLI